MGHFLLLLVVALTVAGVVFGVTVLVSGFDGGLVPAEPDGRAVPLPGTRPLAEDDLVGLRFDMTLRGYRMAQVDQALRRAAYDIGYKDELISVLEAEVVALREGRQSDADVLRRAREVAVGPAASSTPPPAPEPPPVQDERVEEPAAAQPEEPADPVAEPAETPSASDADAPSAPADRS